MRPCFSHLSLSLSGVYEFHVRGGDNNAGFRDITANRRSESYALNSTDAIKEKKKDKNTPLLFCNNNISDCTRLLGFGKCTSEHSPFCSLKHTHSLNLLIFHLFPESC